MLGDGCLRLKCHIGAWWPPRYPNIIPGKSGTTENELCCNKVERARNIHSQMREVELVDQAKRRLAFGIWKIKEPRAGGKSSELNKFPAVAAVHVYRTRQSTGRARICSPKSTVRLPLYRWDLTKDYSDHPAWGPQSKYNGQTRSMSRITSSGQPIT